MLHIGIIGCGKIAQVRHLPEYAAHPQAVLYGLCDANAQRAETLARQYGARAFANAEELLADPQIDAVSICSANHTHAALTIAALGAGKHVLCEKPMATTLQDCEAMVEAAEKSGKTLMIGQNQRLAKAHVRARALLLAGAIGRVLTFRTSFGHGGPEAWSADPGKDVWFFDKNRAVMGAMADLGVHKTDLIQFLLGQTVVETTAYLTTLDKRDTSGALIGVDDNAWCIYRMSGGAVGTMTASWTHYGAEDNATVLYGTKGIMRIYDDPVHSIELVLENGERAYNDLEPMQTNDNQTNSGVIEHFVDCLLQGREPELSGKSVLPAMRAVFASIESSCTGRTIAIGGGEGDR